MLEYCWLFALLLRSARYFPGVEGKWIPLPPMLPPSSEVQDSVQSSKYRHTSQTLQVRFQITTLKQMASESFYWWRVLPSICKNRQHLLHNSGLTGKMHFLCLHRQPCNHQRWKTLRKDLAERPSGSLLQGTKERF